MYLYIYTCAADVVVIPEAHVTFVHELVYIYIYIYMYIYIYTHTHLRS